MRWTVILLLLGGWVLFWLAESDRENEQSSQEVSIREKIEENLSILKEENPKIDIPTKVEKKRQAFIQIEVNETIDTLIDTNVTISLHLDNPLKTYLFSWWLDDGKVVSTDKPILRRTFALGEHPIIIKINDIKGNLLAESNTTVRAWRYLKVKREYFDREEDRYRLDNIKFYNHRKELLLIFSSYYRKTFTYNEFGKVIEEQYENFNYAKDNYTMTYQYEDGRIVFQEKVNGEGEVIESHRYDEVGDEIITVDTEEESDSIVQEDIQQKKPLKFYNKEGNVTHIVLSGDTVLNFRYKNGRKVYREYLYPRGKRTSSMKYNNDGKLIFKEDLSLDLEGNRKMETIWHYDYNKEGKRVRTELEEKIRGEVVRHYIQQWHYKNGLLHSEETNALAGVCPCSSNIIKERTIYTYDKSGNEISNKYEYQREEDTELQQSKGSKEIRSYVNSLE